VWHVPIITEIQAHAPHGTLGLLLVVLPLALAAAAVSYRIVEQPPLRYRRRWTVPREAPGVPASAPADADPGLGPRGFGWLLGAAGAVRLALIVGTPHLPIRNDAADYNRLGRLLAAGHGFGTSALAAAGGPTTFRAPLYPWFLAAVYRLTGDSVIAARCVEAALGVVTVGLVALIADLVWGRRVAWVAAAIAAVLPSLVISSTSVLSESLYMPLEAAAVAAALLAMRTGPRRWWWAALSGLCAGLGILDRPAGFVLVAALAVIVVAGWTHERRELGRRLGTAAVLIVTAVAVLVPWVARDEGTFHALVPVTDIDGFNLAGVYNPVVAGEPYPVAYQWQPPTSSPLFADRSLNEVQLGDALRRQALRWMQDHPTSVVAASFWNTWRMAELTGIGGSTFALDDSGYGRHMAWLEMLSFWLLAVLAAGGLLTRRARTAPLGLWLAPVALWAITAPVLGGSRLRAPIDLFLVLAAAVAVDALARPRPPVPPPSEPEPAVEARLPADSVV
jgi:4-amino-4-deoxy-L-arabinose transferase-like glycosyltransferase